MFNLLFFRVSSAPYNCTFSVLSFLLTHLLFLLHILFCNLLFIHSLHVTPKLRILPTYWSLSFLFNPCSFSIHSFSILSFLFFTLHIKFPTSIYVSLDIAISKWSVCRYISSSEQFFFFFIKHSFLSHISNHLYIEVCMS